LDRLRRRSEFQAAAKGRRVNRPSLALNAAPGEPGAGPRFGFTVTRKVGNAVVRNRVRRRLREAARLVGMQNALPGTNYVVIGRQAALTRPFVAIVKDLVAALVAIDRSGGEKAGPRPTEGR
jgi:ribonuclease P protein component